MFKNVLVGLVFLYLKEIQGYLYSVVQENIAL